MENSIIYGFPVHDVNRDFLFNIGDETGFLKYLLLFSYFVIGCFSIWTMYKYLKNFKHGQSLESIPFYKKISSFFINILFQKKTSKEIFSGVIHFFFMLPAILFLLMQSLYFLNYYLFKFMFGISFLNGYFYLAWTFIVQLSGLLFVVGALLIFYRRLVLRPERLITYRKDILFPVYIVVFLFIYYLGESVRIAVLDRPEFEKWSFVSYRLSGLFTYFSPKSLEILHSLFWSMTAIMCGLLLFFWKNTKFRHIVFAGYNMLINPSVYDHGRIFRNKIIPETRYSYEKTDVCDSKIFDFYDRIEIEACLSCGRCHDVCAAKLAEKNLSPRDVMGTLKNAINSMEEKNLVSEVIKIDDLNECTQCGACSEVCPVNADPMNKILKLRKNKYISNGVYTDSVSTCFDNIEDYGNIYGKYNEDSIFGKNEVNIEKINENIQYDIFLFLGCQARFTSSYTRALKNFIDICKNYNLRVVCLQDDESCCGSIALEKGNDFIFRKTAYKNIEQFRKYNIKKIVTLCPHGFNVLSNEYKRIIKEKHFDCSYEVVFYTEILKEIADKNGIDFADLENKSVVFHDPCMISRYNPDIESGRCFLENGSIDLKEMKNCKEKTLCCGGIESLLKVERPGSRREDLRTRDAYNTGASTLISSCPICYNQFVKSVEEVYTVNIDVKDIAEIFHECIVKSKSS